MSNISITKDELNDILNKLSLDKIDDLFSIIPNKYKFNINELSINEALSEQELNDLFVDISNRNMHAQNAICFMGGGS